MACPRLGAHLEVHANIVKVMLAVLAGVEIVRIQPFEIDLFHYLVPNSSDFLRQPSF